MEIRIDNWGFITIEKEEDLFSIGFTGTNSDIIIIGKITKKYLAQLKKDIENIGNNGGKK